MQEEIESDTQVKLAKIKNLALKKASFDARQAAKQERCNSQSNAQGI